MLRYFLERHDDGNDAKRAEALSDSPAIMETEEFEEHFGRYPATDSRRHMTILTRRTDHAEKGADDNT